jgi:hypothetical protein
MSVTVKPLIQAKYASDSITTEYTAPSSTKAIIDKFTATNTDSGAQTISVHIVANGGASGPENLITSERSLSAGESLDLPELKNHVLNAGDFIAAEASVASKVVIRASGREVT